MKKLLYIIALILALVCALASCKDGEPTVSVNADGYVVVNGVTTEIVADKEDVVTIDTDGYLVVNGVRTEHEIKPIIAECVHSIDCNGICNICNEVIEDTVGVI